MSRSAHPAGPRHGDVLPEPHLSDLAPADVGRLDPTVWPTSAHRGEDGQLRLGGLSISQLVDDHGTPAVIIDEEDLRARARAFAGAIDEITAHYAGKAFLCTELARWIDAEGLGLDVCSGGELAVARAAGFPAARIAFHGNNKSIDELRDAVRIGVGEVIVDSFAEIDRLAAIAAEASVRQRVLVRVTVGVEAHTHEFIATAHEDQKFGFSLRDGSAQKAVGAVLAAGSLHLGGLHSHIGSQIFDTSGFEIAAHRVVELAAAIHAEHGVAVEEINLGGGLGIAYLADDDPQPPAQMLRLLAGIVRSECAARELPMPRLSVEPGRAIVGPAGVTLYRVGTVKDVSLDGGHTRTYVSVDGGMSDNIRTALYDADYSCVLANRASVAAPRRCRVVGRHCESGDIVVREAWLPGDIAPGDLLAVAATGAYCRSMASNYNYIARPPVLAVRAGAARVMLRRETIEDLLRLDAGLADTADAVERTLADG